MLGIESELGSLEKGKLADIIAVRGNPLTDISALRSLFFVMKDGQLDIFLQDASVVDDRHPVNVGADGGEMKEHRPPIQESQYQDEVGEGGSGGKVVHAGRDIGPDVLLLLDLERLLDLLLEGAGFSPSVILAEISQ